MTGPTGRPARRTLVLGGAGLAALLVAGGVWLAVAGGDEPGSAPTADATATGPATPGVQPSIAPSNPPTPTPTGPTSDAGATVATLAPVGLADTAETGGVRGRLVSLTAVQGDGEGAGNIDGPALQVTVELTNGSSDPVSVAAVAVEMYSGADLVPASPIDDSTARNFTGVLQPGESATGVYVFTIAEDQRGDVTVQVAYQAGAPYMVFRGAAD